ncbi:hypothetical protein NE237_002469 [Protea cynaroides]|uniref:Tyrosinase copper-binding domain-containing protein n=1 Tax=Protea cynaroides TaxID=273540 RepID=A0A9Q0KV07_9MAGN|nr:hypothetical protein NE237_002469 [Protea cynaroides]
MACLILSSYPRPNATTFPRRKMLQSPAVGKRRYLSSPRKQELGLYGSASFSADPLALAAPIQPPDFNECGKVLPDGTTTPINCCPPVDLTIDDYKLPPTPNELRVRPAAQCVTDDYLAKYNKAVSLMKTIPDDDPRSFMKQANVHCSYCEGAFHQIDHKDLIIQVHSSWLFFPFHRWFLYFYERILGKLIDDPTFALPFWNYDSSPGMQIPAIFTDKNSSIYNKLRNPNHQPPTVMDLNWSGTDSTTQNNEDLIAANLNTMYRHVSVERVPHNIVHNWTGDPRQHGEDMGNFYSASRDSIFFAHHANVDRLWTIWKGLGGSRKDPTDTDWLDTGSGAGSSEQAKEVEDEENRPKKSRTKKEKEDEEEVLVIDGIKIKKDEFVKFDVFINEDDVTASGPDKTEFAGSFVHVPHGSLMG